MELFIEVASAGGFRAAADRLGMPNSTVSRRISELERDLGLRLFNRTTRRVELTEAGRIYFERCRRIIDEARLAHEELSGIASQPTGLIRASVPVDFTLLYLGDIMIDFLRRYPGVRLDLDVTPRRSNLISDPVDLTIRMGEPAGQQLIARKLTTFKTGLFAAPDYLAAQAPPQSPQDLAHHNCLRLADRPWRLVNLRGGDEAVVAAEGSFRANNIGLLRKMALQGMGVAALAEALVSGDVGAGRLVRVLPEWAPPAIPVYALTETRLLPAKVRVFIDFLIQNLRDKDLAAHDPDGA
jgi:DNA-binding transcriptional LysR family regulator